MAIDNDNLTDDTFWLNLAAESIYTTYEKRKEAILNLQKLIGWGTGLFTTSSFLLYFFPKSEGLNEKSLYFFFAAIALLVVGYFFASASGFPLPSKYNPNDAEQIKDEFTKSVKRGAILFNFAVLFVFIGFLFISLGVFKQTEKPTLPKPPESKERKVTTSIEMYGDSTFIPVTIENAQAAKARLIIKGYKSGFIVNKTNPEILIASGVYSPDTLGRAFISTYVKDSALKYFIVSVGFRETKSESSTEEHLFYKNLRKK